MREENDDVIKLVSDDDVIVCTCNYGCQLSLV